MTQTLNTLGQVKTAYWICLIIFALALSGCVRSEDALDSSDSGPTTETQDPSAQNPPDQGNDPVDPPPADPPMDPPPADPPMDPPPVDPPMDPPPVDPPMDPPPVDPPPADPPESDLQLFQQTLHPVLTDAANLCASCHAGGLDPAFADADAQTAYDIIIADALVDRTVPMASRLFERAAFDRHNCGNDASCDTIANALLAGIEGWAGMPPADPPVDPDPPMDPPPPVDPDPPMDPPPMTDVMVFESTLYPLLTDPANFCVGCHGANQIPTFAVDNVVDAYNAIVTQQKVDLNNPGLSRIYLRPAEDRHNCGGVASCDQIAADFLLAIQAWADAQIPADDPAGIVMSAATNAGNAQEAGTARADANLIAYFAFEEGTGDTTMDTSGVGTPVTLNIEGMAWEPGGGLRNLNGKAQASADDSRKLFDMISPVGEFTVEAWVIPDNTAQDGPARIVSYSQDTAVRNFTMGQNAIYYVFRNRSANTGQNGTPQLEALEREVSTSLQHVVMTFDQTNGRTIYLDGQPLTTDGAADTLDWNANQIFLLGNEVTNDRLWQGVFKLVAVHNKALSALEVNQNFEAGLGDLRSLRFDLSALLGGPAYIDTLFRQIDANAYLFAEPTYVSAITGVQVKNIRIGVNGSVPVAAQAFRRIDVTVEQSGTRLSPLGAVIPAVNGPDMDQFHLEFEVLGSNQGIAEEIAPPAPPPSLPDVEEPDIGVRSFAQIRDTMSSLTGIDPNNGVVLDLYEELLGQLPATVDVLSYGPTQQIAIQRLANGFCGRIVANAGRCSDFFGACEIQAGTKGQIADALFDRFIGDNLAVQPMRADVNTEIVGLMDDLSCAAGCSDETARIALSAACSAVLSSGAVMLN